MQNVKLEQEVIELSKEKWRWMSEHTMDSLDALFHEKSVFVHMGGAWAKSVKWRSSAVVVIPKSVRKERMAVPYLPLIALVLTVILLSACAPVPTTTPLLPTVVLGTPSALPTASSSPQPTHAATTVSASQAATGETQIRVIIGDTVLTGQLWDNATARDLIAQLPLTLTFSDFNRLEKIVSLPQKLSLDGVPEGDDPLPSDIGYYAPWGNLVFYYGDVGYFNGIVRIGHFDGNMDAVSNQTSDFTARIELAK